MSLNVSPFDDLIMSLNVLTLSVSSNKLFTQIKTASTVLKNSFIVLNAVISIKGRF